MVGPGQGSQRCWAWAVGAPRPPLASTGSPHGALTPPASPRRPPTLSAPAPRAPGAQRPGQCRLRLQPGPGWGQTGSNMTPAPNPANARWLRDQAHRLGRGGASTAPGSSFCPPVVQPHQGRPPISVTNVTLPDLDQGLSSHVLRDSGPGDTLPTENSTGRTGEANRKRDGRNTASGQGCGGPSFQRTGTGRSPLPARPQLGVTQLRAGGGRHGGGSCGGTRSPSRGHGEPPPSPRAPHLSSGTGALAAPGRPQHPERDEGIPGRAQTRLQDSSDGWRQRPRSPSVLLTVPPPASSLAPRTGPAHTREPEGAGRCGGNRCSSRGRLQSTCEAFLRVTQSSLERV